MAIPNNLFGDENVIRNRFENYTDKFMPKVAESTPKRQADTSMSDLTRQEIQATIAASEARVAATVEAMRADSAELRADLRDGISQIKASGAAAQVNADRFYAEARTVLAESRAALTEIKLAGEQNRTNVMTLGYKILTWLFGAILALVGLFFTIKKATAPDTPPPAAVGVSTPSQSASPAASPPRQP